MSEFTISDEDLLFISMTYRPDDFEWIQNLSRITELKKVPSHTVFSPTGDEKQDKLLSERANVINGYTFTWVWGDIERVIIQNEGVMLPFTTQ